MVLIKLLLLCVVFMSKYGSNFSLVPDRFVEIRRSPYFMDKTLLIREVLNVHQPLILTAPDGFGKSTNLDMVRSFLSAELNSSYIKSLFHGTGISKDEQIMNKQLGNHTVLYCSFKPDREIFNYYTFISAFRTILYRTYSDHFYLIRSRKLSRYEKKSLTSYTGVKKHQKLKSYQIIVGIDLLTRLLKKHHNNQVVLMIDDYDSMLLDCIFKSEINLDYVLGMYNAIMSTLLHDNHNIDKIILAGNTCTCMKRLMHMNHLRCIGFLQDKAFSPFFGITEHELDSLLSKQRYHDKKNRKDEIRNWYGGYVSPDLRTHAYNTMSTLSFLESGDLKSYWSSQRSFKTIKNLLIEPYVQDVLEDSVFYKKPIDVIFNDTINHDDLRMLKSFTDYELWNDDYGGTFMYLLMEKGYFTFAQSCYMDISGPKNMTIKIPNNEIGEVFRHINATLFANPIEILDRLKAAIHQISYCEKTENYEALLEMTEKPGPDPLQNKIENIEPNV